MYLCIRTRITDGASNEKKKREKSDVELRLFLSKSFDDRVLGGKENKKKWRRKKKKLAIFPPLAESIESIRVKP